MCCPPLFTPEDRETPTSGSPSETRSPGGPHQCRNDAPTGARSWTRAVFLGLTDVTPARSDIPVTKPPPFFAAALSDTAAANCSASVPSRDQNNPIECERRTYSAKPTVGEDGTGRIPSFKHPHSSLGNAIHTPYHTRMYRSGVYGPREPIRSLERLA